MAVTQDAVVPALSGGAGLRRTALWAVFRSG